MDKPAHNRPQSQVPPLGTRGSALEMSDLRSMDGVTSRCGTPNERSIPGPGCPEAPLGWAGAVPRLVGHEHLRVAEEERRGVEFRGLQHRAGCWESQIGPTGAVRRCGAQLRAGEKNGLTGVPGW